MGATSISSSSSYVPLALNDLAGTKIKIIRGYAGAPPIALAMERGEVNAHGGIALEAILAGKEEWLKEKKASFLYYLGGARFAGRPEVPGLLDFATDERSRSIFGLLGGAVSAAPSPPNPAHRRSASPPCARPSWR